MSYRFADSLRAESGVFHCTQSNYICHIGLLTVCEQSQEFFTVHTEQLYMSYRFADSLRAESGVFHCTRLRSAGSGQNRVPS